MPLRDSFQWIKKNYFTFLKTYQKEVFVLFILLYPISLFFYLQVEQFKNPTPDMDKMRIITLISIAVTEYLIQILRQIFLFILLYGLYFNKRLRSPLASILKYFTQVFAECLRCVLPILLKSLPIIPAVVCVISDAKNAKNPENKGRFWSLGFSANILQKLLVILIPGLLGFIEYIRLTFVAPIVLFSKEYDAGNEDALETSRKWTFGNKVNILIIYLIYAACSVVSQALIAEVIPEGLINHFFVFTAGFFIDVFIYLFIGCYFFAIFPKAQTAFQE